MNICVMDTQNELLNNPISMADETLTILNEKKAARHISNAHDLIDSLDMDYRKEIENAISLYSDAIAMYPENPELYKKRGIALAEKDGFIFKHCEQDIRKLSAIEDYENALELKADDIEIYKLLGDAYAGFDCISAWSYFDPLQNAIVAGIEPDRIKAVYYYTKALELSPLDCDILMKRIEVYALLSLKTKVEKDKDYYMKKIVEDYNIILGLSPDAWSIISNRPDILAILQIISKSTELEQLLTKLIAETSHSIELNPDDANGWRSRGWLLSFDIKKNADQVIRDYNEVLRIDPDGKTLGGFEERHNCLEMIGIAKAYRIIKNGEDDECGYVELDDMIGLHWRGVGFAFFYEYERAIKDYDAALALKANDYDTFKDREIAVNALKNNGTKLAIDKLARTMPMRILQRHNAVGLKALGCQMQKKIDEIFDVLK